MASTTTRDGVPSYSSIPPSPIEDRDTSENDALIEEIEYQRGEERRFLSQHASEPQNFTLRGIFVGLGVGLIVCFSNMYFGLQSEHIAYLPAIGTLRILRKANQMSLQPAGSA